MRAAERPRPGERPGGHTRCRESRPLRSAKVKAVPGQTAEANGGGSENPGSPAHVREPQEAPLFLAGIGLRCLLETTPVNHRRSRTKFTQDQLKILIKAFDKNPYPGYATKQKLALEANTEESRIQIWFQNRRARHQKKSEPDEDLESSQDQDHLEEEIQSREDRRSRTNYTSLQLHALIEAFSNNPYPGFDSREQLAKEIGVPESRVQIWFQNRRSRFHAQRKSEPDDGDLEQRQDQEQDL
ncbi:double homeobox protein A [Panthera tigris]|uniref:double homeobox protein A n=1 Tax=Panthera tigris TaxID=9694 RepID=UPI001C6F79A2|nr:double homeobox protein A [Panthera tigris]